MILKLTALLFLVILVKQVKGKRQFDLLLSTSPLAVTQGKEKILLLDPSHYF